MSHQAGCPHRSRPRRRAPRGGSRSSRWRSARRRRTGGRGAWVGLAQVGVVGAEGLRQAQPRALRLRPDVVEHGEDVAVLRQALAGDGAGAGAGARHAVCAGGSGGSRGGEGEAGEGEGEVGGGPGDGGAGGVRQADALAGLGGRDAGGEGGDEGGIPGVVGGEAGGEGGEGCGQGAEGEEDEGSHPAQGHILPKTQNVLF